LAIAQIEPLVYICSSEWCKQNWFTESKRFVCGALWSK
jgi:hypothetical protein